MRIALRSPQGNKEAGSGQNNEVRDWSRTLAPGTPGEGTKYADRGYLVEAVARGGRSRFEAAVGRARSAGPALAEGVVSMGQEFLESVDVRGFRPHS